MSKTPETNVAQNLAREWVVEHLREARIPQASVQSATSGSMLQAGKAGPEAIDKHFVDVDVSCPSDLPQSESDRMVSQLKSANRDDPSMGGRVSNSRLLHEQVMITRQDSHDHGRDAWRIRVPFAVSDPGDPGAE